jgi:outer membrane protein with beta-barrel domain
MEEHMHLVVLMLAQTLMSSWPPPGEPESILDADDPARWLWRIGARGNISTSWGEPANDINGGGVYVARRLSERWTISADLYYGAFDFENPGDVVLGTSGTPTADAKISLTILSATAEWHPLDPGGDLDVYLGLGLGIANTGDGDTPAKTGVDVEVTGSTGFELHARAGAAYRVFSRAYLVLEAQYMQVFSSMDVEDQLTGESDTMSSFDQWGFTAGVEVRF